MMMYFEADDRGLFEFFLSSLALRDRGKQCNFSQEGWRSARDLSPVSLEYVYNVTATSAFAVKRVRCSL